jgi:hypothetical protein
MMEGLHANSQGPFTQRKHLVCVSGEVLSTSKKKNHGVLSEMTEAFGSKRLRKERQGNNHDESRATTTTTTSPPSSIGSLL